MRLRRKFPSLALVLMMLLAAILCGCADSAAETETPAAVPETEPVVPAEETVVSFLAMPENGGTIAGISTQTLLPGERTTKVEAVAAPGFVFVEWSDGEKNAVHREKRMTEDAEIYAIFEETDESTPALYINTADGKAVRSDQRTVDFTLTVTGLPRRYCLKEATGQIKTRGNASLGWPKLSYTIRLDQKVKLCGLGEGKNRNWVLISNHCDQSLMRNYLAFWLQAQMDGIPWSPDCRMVDVYLNGEYVGNYMLIEKVTTGPSRIDIENYEDTENLRADFLLELDQYANKSGEKGLTWFTARGYPYEIRGEDNITKARCDYVDEWVTSAWDVICDGNEREIRKILNVESVVDSYIVAELTKNIDCGWSSFFLYRKDGVLYLGPAWDFDLAMGNDMRLDDGSYRRLYAAVERGFTQQNRWYIELMEHDWFKKLVVERWNELWDAGLFEKLIEEYDRAYAMNYESFEHNFERWPIFGQRLNQEPDSIRALGSVEEHRGVLREWLINRAAWLNDTFNGDF